MAGLKIVVNLTSTLKERESQVHAWNRNTISKLIPRHRQTRHPCFAAITITRMEIQEISQPKARCDNFRIVTINIVACTVLPKYTTTNWRIGVGVLQPINVKNISIKNLQPSMHEPISDRIRNTMVLSCRHDFRMTGLADLCPPQICREARWMRVEKGGVRREADDKGRRRRREAADEGRWRRVAWGGERAREERRVKVEKATNFLERNEH